MFRRVLRLAFAVAFHIPLLPWILLSELLGLTAHVAHVINNGCWRLVRRDHAAQAYIIDAIYLPIARRICSDADCGRLL